MKPKYLNLFTLAPKMSITAKISILHRISGVLLFLSIPFMIYVLNKSLISDSFYNMLYTNAHTLTFKLIYLALIWAFTYHICAGIRFLFMDIAKGVEIKNARTTAYVTVVVSTILTILLGLLIC